MKTKSFVIAICLIIASFLRIDAQTSKIIFYRSYKIMGSALKPNLYLNDTVVAKMKSRIFKVVEIPSKTVEFYSYLTPTFLNHSNIMTKLKLHLVPNTVYFVKYSLEGMNNQIRPGFELLNKEQLRTLSKKSDLKSRLKENNIKIDDISDSYSDTITTINSLVKLVYDPSQWSLYNVPDNMKWDSYLVSHNKFSAAYISESSTRLSDSNIEDLVKKQMGNYIVKSVKYKGDTINGLPAISIDAQAEYAGTNYKVNECIYSSDKGTFCLLINSRTKDYETNKSIIEQLIKGFLKY